MFGKKRITADKIARLAVSSMLKRTANDIEYGAIMISEGVFHFMETQELTDAGIHFTTDAHGHPELHSISKSHVFSALIGKMLKNTQLDIRTRPVEIGFSLRTVTPSAFDLKYCSRLGNGVYELFSKGYSGCMVSQLRDSTIAPLFLKDHTDSNGKVIPRMVNINNEDFKCTMRNSFDYIKEADYASIKELTNTQALFDFDKIMAEA